MTYHTVYTDVEIDMTDINTDVLIEELESRGVNCKLGISSDQISLLIDQIWQKKRLNKDYDQELDTLIYNTIGKSL